MILSPLGSLPFGRFLGISEIKRDIDQYILMETCLVLFSIFSGIFTSLGDMELDITGVIFISFGWDIDWGIVGLIGRSRVLS